MSYQDRLRTEINATLDQLAAEQQPWIAKWVAHHICKVHSDGIAENEHSDFWRHCTYVECRRQVTECINKRAGDKPSRDSEQLKLNGWDHLQAYYVVTRDGEDVGIPVSELTDEEIEAKATLYRKMADACQAHADELDRFRRLRRMQEAA